MAVGSAGMARSGSHGLVDPRTGVLGEYPLDFSRPEVRTLRDLFSRTFYTASDIHALLFDAGIHLGSIDYSGSASTQWFAILNAARAQERIGRLLDAVRAAAPALGRRMDELLDGAPVLDPGLGAPDDLSEASGPGWTGFGARGVAGRERPR